MCLCHTRFRRHTLPNLGNVMDAVKVAVRCPKKKAAKARLANVAVGGSPRSFRICFKPRLRVCLRLSCVCGFYKNSCVSTSPFLMTCCLSHLLLLFFMVCVAIALAVLVTSTYMHVPGPFLRIFIVSYYFSTFLASWTSVPILFHGWLCRRP